MRKSTILVTALILSVSPAAAQQASVVGRDFWDGILYRINDIRPQDEGEEEIASDPAYLESIYPKSMLDTFFSNSVIKVSLYPDGTYAALAQSGGEVTAIKLGKKSLSVDGPAYATDGWGFKAGEYPMPKRAQKLALTFAARGQQMTVECATKFSRSEHAITFYVGPMNGLQCLGLADDSVMSAAELVKTAEAQMARAAPAGGN